MKIRTVRPFARSCQTPAFAKPGQASRRILHLLATAGLFLLGADGAKAQISISGDVSPSPADNPTWNVGGDLIVGDVTSGNLTISTGGTVSNNYGWIGNNTDSTGTATVTGGNWTNSSDFYVGYLGNGSLALSDGTVSNASGFIGAFSGSTGTVTVTGGTWTNSSDFYVGNFGNGSLTLSNGTVSNTFGVIGNNSGTTGTVTITGGTWTNTSTLFVGRSGNGTLNLSGTGSISASSVTVALFSSSNGSVSLLGGTLSTGQVSEGSGNGTVTFNGGTLRLTGNQTDLFSGFETGDVQLIASGGTIDTQDFAIASALGLTGSGSLAKQGGGNLTLTGNNTYTGGTTVRNGTLTVSNGGAINHSTANLIVGSNFGDNATFTLSNGTVSNAVAFVGDLPGATGTANVTGGNWTNSSLLSIGGNGNGTLNLSGGNVTGFTGVGRNPGSTGVANVTGGNLNALGLLQIGINSNGTLNLSNGTVTSSSTFMGVRTGSLATANITGGTWNSGGLNIGEDGNATVNLSNGTVTSTAVALGLSSGSMGRINVTGGNWTNSGGLTIGLAGNGTLELSNGTVSNSAGTLGQSSGSVGTATITGGTWNNSAGLIIGASGIGTLNVSNATVTSTSGDLGFSAGSTGTATITSSSWTNSATLSVGALGNGTLTLSNGTVSNTDGFVGRFAGATGTATVTGGNWTNSGELYVGFDGVGTLNLSNGTVSNTQGSVGLGSGSSGTVNVTGGSWANSGELSIGREGTGTLNVSNGTVSNTSGLVGVFGGATGTVNVTGGNWTNSGPVVIGFEGDGTLNLSSGTVRSTLTVLGQNATGQGAANLTGGVLSVVQLSEGAGNGNVTFNGGTLQLTSNQTALFNGFETGDVQLLTNGGTIDTQAFTVTTAVGIGGNGSLTKTGSGTLTLSGNNTYTGDTIVSAGTLIANNTTGSSRISIGSGATLAGNGTITGNVNVANGGILSPGNSPGILTISGNLSLSAMSISNFELDAPFPAAGSDRVDVGGNLILDGTLNLTTISGFGAGTYRLFNYGGSLTDNGLTFGIIPGLFEFAIDTTTANEINLIVTAATLQYWDGTNTTPDGVVNGGNGTWDGTTTNWTNVNGTLNDPWAGTLGAVFEGTAGTVTIADGFTAQTPSLFFRTAGYVLAATGNGTLALTGGGIVDVLTGNATISAPITGNATLAKTGNGTLVLDGPNTYTGGTSLQNGTLFVGNDAAFGTGTLAISSNTTLGADDTYSLANDVNVLGNFSADVATGEILELGGLTSLGNSTRTVTLLDDGLFCFSGEVTGNAGLTFVRGAGAMLPSVSLCGPDSNTFTGTLTVGSNVQLQLEKDPGQIAVAGNLTIQAGGVVELFDALDQISANSTVTVDGELGLLNISSNNTATFAVLNGAATGLIENLSSPVVLAIGAGDYAGNIDDTGVGALELRKFGNGTFTLRGDTTIQGDTTVQGGTLALTDSASITNAASDLVVGQSSGDNGTVTINGTASISSDETYIGNDGGSRGLAQISGGNLTNTNRLFVGYTGNGTLEISGTGQVASDNTFIGSSPGGVGRVSVSGGDFSSTTNLFVGNQGNGTLEITGGSASNVIGFIGSDAGSNGIATVSGGTWKNTGDLRVGQSGNGTLNVRGGTVASTFSTLGVNVGSFGAVNVSGGNWTNSGPITVGDQGSGVVTITGGITTASSFTLASQTGSTGTLNFGNGNTVGTIGVGSISSGLGNATVNFNHAGNVLFASSLTGRLAVNKLGTGTTSISTANTYSGGTTVTEGTLQTTNTNALGAGPVTVNGGTLDPVGTLNINSLTWNGGSIASTVGTSTDFINSTGALTLGAGGGTFVFDAGTGFAIDTPYTILSASNLTDAFLSLFSGNTLGGFVPTFTRDGLNLIVTFLNAQGALDGPVLQNSAPYNTPRDGVFTINGNVQTGSPTANNTIFGLIFNPASVLQVFNTLTVTGGNLTVNGNATLTGGTVFVPGTFNKNGIGNLNVQSLLQILGLGNVNNGGLFVNGILQALGLNILPDGTLGGAGTIFGNVLNFGNVSPGNSPGTLSIVGNFTQASSGALNLEIASLSNFDRLVVTGNAALAGTLNVVPFDGFAPAYGQQFAFLQAGSITGTFDTINAPAQFRGRFLTNGGTGTLLLAPDTYTRVAITDNQRRVARALDTFIPATTGDRAAVSLALDLQTAAQYPGAFDQIAPTLHETIADISLEQSFTQTQLLNQRMSSVRLGARGFQAIGLNAEPLRHDKDGKSVADPKDLKSQVENLANPRWSTWVIGSGMFANIRGLGQLPNLSFQSGGFLAGADYAWSDNLTTGLYGGYQGTYADYGNSGDARINTTSFGAYATYTAGGFYADAVIGGGYSNYKVNRSIEFSTIDRTAASQQNGGQFTTGLNFGYDWKASGFTFGPVFGAQYTLASISPFTETGAGALNLRVAQQNANSLRTTLGGRIAYTWNVSEKITLIPEVRAFWQHEFLENPRVIGASLNSGNGAGFNYVSAAPDRDAIFTAAGLTAQFGETWNASLYYNTSFANETTLIHTISASVGLSF